MEENLNAEKPHSFKGTVSNIKKVFQNSEIDGTSKYNTITQLFRKYFDTEDISDVFEGALRLINTFYNYATEMTGAKDTSLAVQCMQVYEEYLTQLEPFHKDMIADSMPQEKDVYLKALKVASMFKQKHLPKIAIVFHLNNPNHSAILIKLIKHIMKKDLPKSIEWIVFFKLRDAFSAFFKEIVCQLFLLNLPKLLEDFVGEDRYRKLELIAYFDELFSLELKKFKGRSDSEEYVLSETKRLEKFATRYMKLYDIPEINAPNILNYRTRSALLFHHYRWANGEMLLINFEEIALHAMSESPFIKRFYLDFLCNRKRGLDALYFAYRLSMTESEFPLRLGEFAREHPEEVEKIKKDTLSIKKEKEHQIKQTLNEDCQLENGFPVYYVTDWQEMRRVMKILRDEPVIGIDTEWKPHYAFVKEQVALIQICCSTAVFLIDVVVLELRISNDQWLEFFTSIFCEEDRKKIGFDFANDLRVLKSSFPFLSLIAPESKNIVCLYRLLQQIVINPEAEKLVFPDEKLSNIRLYEVAKHFMNIELDKSEQNSNWMERPMRHEKKVYAALDAYCLVGCFQIIAERLMKLENSSLLYQLQNAALVNFAEPKHPFHTKKALNSETGEYEITGVSKLKENDSEFVESVLKVTKELEAEAAAQPQFKANFKSIDDYRFVMDSMLFGLGQKLRRCGFETEMIADREELVRFCQQKTDFIAVSTGKAFKKLEVYLPSERVLCVPMNTNDPKLNSQLVTYIMRKLNIAIYAQDMRARCVKCNVRAFVRVPRLIIKAIFFLNAVEKSLDWLEIGMPELRSVFEDLLSHAAVPELSSNMLADDEYMVNIYENQMTCRSRHCSIDIMNRLILAEGDNSPVELGQTMSIPLDALDDMESNYYVCTQCGKIQYTWPNQTAKEAEKKAAEIAAKKQQKEGAVQDGSVDSENDSGTSKLTAAATVKPVV